MRSPTNLIDWLELFTSLSETMLQLDLVGPYTIAKIGISVK